MRETVEPGRSGEASADQWQQIWSHREDLLKVARRRSLCPQDAEDAVHEAMARAAERPHLDPVRLGAWLTSVTVRLCVDQHRRLSRDAALSHRVGTVLVGHAAVPHEEMVCDREEARWLAVRSTELPASQEEALRLRAQELDVAQVAERMGLTYKAAESLLGRARRTLRAVLAATLTVVLGVWRGRPRTDGGTSAAAPGMVLVSAGATLVIAGLALVTPVATDATGPMDGAAAPQARDHRHPIGPSAPSPAESALAVPGSSAPATAPANLRTPEPVAEPGAGPVAEDVPASPADSGAEQRALPNAPAADLPALPPVPVSVPEAPSVVVVPDLAAPGSPGVPDPMPSLSPGLSDPLVAVDAPQLP